MAIELVTGDVHAWAGRSRRVWRWDSDGQQVLWLKQNQALGAFLLCALPQGSLATLIPPTSPLPSEEGCGKGLSREEKI